MVVKMVKEELEGHEVKTESNGFLQVGKVKSGVKLKSRLKMDPEMFIAASKAHPALLDGRKKPVLEIASHTWRFCKFWTNERSGRFAYFYCVGKVRVKCRVSAKAFCVNKEEASFEKNRKTRSASMEKLLNFIWSLCQGSCMLKIANINGRGNVDCPTQL